MEITDKINKLNLRKIEVGNISKIETSNGSFYRVEIFGGFNGNGDWITYLDQIKMILTEFPNSKIVQINTDLPDDVWDLKFNIPIN